MPPCAYQVSKPESDVARARATASDELGPCRATMKAFVLGGASNEVASAAPGSVTCNLKTHKLQGNRLAPGLAFFLWGRFRSRAPGPPPFSSMNYASVLYCASPVYTVWPPVLCEAGLHRWRLPLALWPHIVRLAP